MKKISADLLVKVRGEFSPNGLSKVFVSFNPSDVSQMEIVTNDILTISNCAIYYHTDSFLNKNIDFEDYGIKLKEMKLFVVIITTNYLTTDSFSKCWEYNFAIKHNIPIIPIAMESELEDFFTTEMNCIGEGFGDIQLLQIHSSNKTEIPYKQKLLDGLFSNVDIFIPEEECWELLDFSAETLKEAKIYVVESDLNSETKCMFLSSIKDFFQGMDFTALYRCENYMDSDFSIECQKIIDNLQCKAPFEFFSEDKSYEDLAFDECFNENYLKAIDLYKKALNEPAIIIFHDKNS